MSVAVHLVMDVLITSIIVIVTTHCCKEVMGWQMNCYFNNVV